MVEHGRPKEKSRSKGEKETIAHDEIVAAVLGEEALLEAAPFAGCIGRDHIEKKGRVTIGGPNLPIPRP